MSNEKQNNSWKDRLDQLEQLPGATLAKDAAWEKLYDRLQEKPRRKRIAWYIPAAACLLLVCFVAWMITNNKKQQGDIAVQPPAQRQQPATKPLKELQPTVIDDIPEHAIIVQQPVKTKASRENRPIIRTPDALIYSVPVNNKPKEDIVMIIPKDTVMALTIAAAPKKKLKMVHLNEVGRPAEEEARMARSANWHSPKITFNSPDVFAQPIYNNSAPREERDALKVKVTSQN